jgi:hypothetical protein
MTLTGGEVSVKDAERQVRNVERDVKALTFIDGTDCNRLLNDELRRGFGRLTE